MTTDWRALCVEAFNLLYEYDNGQRVDWDSWKERARAALADELVTRRFINNPVQIAECGGPCADEGPEACDCGALWCDLPVPAPANVEMAELVAWLEEEADDYACIGNTDAARNLNRAVELLQRLSPPQPVPVSEGLPGPEDCDAEGRCWWGTPNFVNSYAVTQSAQWRLSAPDDRFGSELFWLPAHALPLPGQEVDG